MNKRGRPAVDQAVMSAYGVTRGGQPMAYSRAPAPDLAPWLARLSAARIDLREGHSIDCGVLFETAMMRLHLSGDWSFQTVRGPKRLGKAALYFMPQNRRMPLSVTGSFVSVGQSMRPGSTFAFSGPLLNGRLDDLLGPDEMEPGMNALCDSLDPQGDPEDWLLTLENSLRTWIAKYNCPRPDPITAEFELLSFANPKASVAEFAEQYGVSERTVERTILRDFGMSPKQALRRARALDMASVLRGVADPDEVEQIELRYYDQSHLIREFTELFGMSPSLFAATPQPIMTLALESRQARRLEVLERIKPGGARPWE